MNVMLRTNFNLTMVKANRVHELGGPEVLKWEFVEIRGPKEGEIRVRNKAIGINFIDVYYHKGVFKAATMPFIPGMEAAGLVTAVSPGLTGRKVGDVVAYYVEVPPSIYPKIAAFVLLKGMTAQFLVRHCFKGTPFLSMQQLVELGPFCVSGEKPLVQQLLELFQQKKRQHRLTIFMILFQSHPNMVILGEEIVDSNLTLFDITKRLCEAVQARAQQDKYQGVILLHEGLIESIPEVHTLLQLLLSPESDDSAQMSQIETEKLLAQLVETEMTTRTKNGAYTGKKFSSICHFFGYQARG